MRDVFVIGTGDSILSLSSKEIDYINNSENIVVNSHLIFNKLSQIKPKNWVYVDNNEKTDMILKYSYLNGDEIGAKWFLGDYHIKRLKELNIEPLSEIIRFNSEYSSLTWSSSLNDKFFWCSILGLALNLSTVLYPKSRIKIIGMDGYGGQHFYSKNLGMYGKEIMRNYTPHTRNIGKPHESVNWFKWGLPIIIENIEKRGGKVYHCNMNSMFVDENHKIYIENENLKPKRLFEYKQIID